MNMISVVKPDPCFRLWILRIVIALGGNRFGSAPQAGISGSPLALSAT
jgi:hypothetical protein